MGPERVNVWALTKVPPMAQQRMRSDEVMNIITTWDIDDELSSDEEIVVTQLSSSTSPGASSTFIARESSDENKSDDKSTGTTSTQDATAFGVTDRNLDILQTCINR